MRNLMTTIIVFLIISSFQLSGCKKFEDIRVVEDIAYEPEFAIPLINSSISLQDILDSEDNIALLDIDADGNMTLNYDAEFEHNSASELIGEIPTFPLVLTDTVTSVPVQIFDNIELNSISLKSGTISFNLQSGIPENIDVTITIPQLTKNGLPFSTNLELVYLGSLPVFAMIDPISIEGYFLDLVGNSVDVNYEAITNSGDHVVLDLVTGAAENWNYDLIQGIAEQQTFSISKDSIEIDLYDSWLEGEISFEDPRIAIEIENSFGFPMGVQLVNVVAITSSGNEVNLTTTNNSFEVNYPLLSEVGEAKTTTFFFDKNNSNIKDILNTKPTKLYYEIEGTLNPNNTNDPGFISDQSDLSSLLSLELPIHGSASGFTIQSSAEMDIGTLENIRNAEFKIITDNGLPIDVDLQLYFQDENENIIDSLFNQPQALLAAASVDAHGNTTGSVEVTTYIDVPEERMLMIQNAKNVLIDVSFSTYNNGNTSVRINSSQEVGIRMGAKVGLEN